VRPRPQREKIRRGTHDMGRRTIVCAHKRGKMGLPMRFEQDGKSKNISTWPINITAANKLFFGKFGIQLPARQGT
jgi:hypothetical protein